MVKSGIYLYDKFIVSSYEENITERVVEIVGIAAA